MFGRSTVPHDRVLAASARRRGGQPDLIAELGNAGERSRLVVEAKANGQPRFARSAAQQLRRYLGDEEYGILIAPYVSERSASILSEEGIGFVDLAGDRHLCFNQVYVRREGRGNPFSESREAGTRESPLRYCVTL